MVAPAMWRKCGHPRSKENTTAVSAQRPSGKCRQCQRAAERRYKQTERGVLSVRRDSANAIAAGRNARNRARYNARKAYELSSLQNSGAVRVDMPRVRVLAVINDLQMPFEDPPALNQALEVIARVQPDTVVLNGDVVDCYAESVFLKDWKLAETATPEGHKRARRLMECLEDVPQKIWLGGNHEERWKKELWRELARGDRVGAIASNLVAAMNSKGADIDLSDPAGSFSRIYNMSEHGFTYYPWHHRLYFAEGNLVVTHGEFIRKDSGVTARVTFEWLGRSVIVGHSHRLGSYLTRRDGREFGGWEGGCLCELEPEYCTTPNWQQGLTIVRIDGPEFHVIQVPIVRRDGKPVAVYNE